MTTRCLDRLCASGGDLTVKGWVSPATWRGRWMTSSGGRSAGVRVTADYADFEFGLRWDRERDGFDVSLRFTGADTVDRVVHPEVPLTIDLQRLAGLVNDESAYGTALTEMVLQPEEVAQFYKQAIAAARSTPVRLRIILDGPSRFHYVRWELLREPVNGHAIATSPNILFSRYFSSPSWGPIPGRPAHDPRALVVVAAPSNLDEYAPGGRRLPPVDVDREISLARGALNAYLQVTLAGSGEATMANVVEILERSDDFDILYLVAHGASTGDVSVPVLFLEKPDGTVDPVDGRLFAERIYDLKRKPSLVMLLSCQSTRPASEFDSGDGGALVGLGPRLAAAGVAAVVGMQANVTMQTISRFMPLFFTELLKDGVVDRAVAVARDAVRDRPDWWVPVLFSRLRSGRMYSDGLHQPNASAVRSAFVSYSHKDERYRHQLDISLVQLRRNKLISIWYDRKILPGQEWGQEIDKNLERADIVLLLVSPDFLASDYAYSREMLRALERHQSGSATVVPIIVRPSDWKDSPLGALQALPSAGRPVTRWSNRDQAWLDVAQGLRRLISNQG